MECKTTLILVVDRYLQHFSRNTFPLTLDECNFQTLYFHCTWELYEEEEEEEEEEKHFFITL
jgi:hypothetical protein